MWWCFFLCGKNRECRDFEHESNEIYNGDISMWLHLKIQGPDQPPKPTGDPDPRSRPAIQTDPDLTIQTYDPDL